MYDLEKEDEVVNNYLDVDDYLEEKEDIEILKAEVERVCQKFGCLIRGSYVINVGKEEWTMCSMSTTDYNHCSYEVAILFPHYDPVVIFVNDPSEQALRVLIGKLVQWGLNVIDSIIVRNNITGIPWQVHVNWSNH